MGGRYAQSRAHCACCCMSERAWVVDMRRVEQNKRTGHVGTAAQNKTFKHRGSVCINFYLIAMVVSVQGFAVIIICACYGEQQPICI